jgi:hypothetical protein
MACRSLLGWRAGGYAGARSFAFSGGGDQLSGLTEAGRRHAAVYGFVLAGLDDVSFVLDADIAPAASDSAIEINPGRPVLLVFGARVGFQMLKGAPILDDDGPETAVA